MSDVAPERWQPRTLTTVPTSAKSLEAVAEDARQRGYADGLAQGQAEAQKQGEKTAVELATLWRSMQRPIAHQDLEVSEHLLALVVATVTSVLRRELTTDENLIKNTLEAALARLAEADAPLIITLNPADKTLVENLLTEHRLEADIVGDSTMLRGGCRLERGHALVDATIESQISVLIDQIAEADTPSASEAAAREPLDPDRISAIAKRFSGEPHDA